MFLTVKNQETQVVFQTSAMLSVQQAHGMPGRAHADSPLILTNLTAHKFTWKLAQRHPDTEDCLEYTALATARW